MKQSRIIKISKYLSYHLRHHPEKLGLTLDVGGWVSVDELLKSAKKHGFLIFYFELKEVVAKNDKQRFSFDETGSKIRANQGHSVAIDLQLESVPPPDILYHGTGEGSVESILSQGLLKMNRHHVHLSVEMQTARKVGERHGRPVIFAIDAIEMYGDGYQFYCSDNGVWLVEQVPPKYLHKM